MRKANLPQFLLSDTAYLAFNKKITRHAKREKNYNYKETRIRLRYGRDTGIIRPRISHTHDEYVECSSEKTDNV